MTGALDEAALARAAALVARSGDRHITVLTGAGISTDAGIPDFRGPNGVWTRNPGAERLSSLEAYLNDASVRRASWQNRLASPVFSAQPTRAHHALVDLERRGLLDVVITQNTDGLHLAAGHDPARVLEVHGTAHYAECWSCGDRRPIQQVLERVRGGDLDPHCDRHRSDGAGLCGGIVKSATVSFGQSLDPETLERACAAAQRCDVFLAIGSTLEVQPVASLVPLAERSGAAVVIVNGSPTALDGLADVVVRGSISEIVPRLVPG